VKRIYVAVSSVKGYSHVMKYLDDITSHPQRECIEQRVEIIKFFDDYGEDATRRAFGKSRSSVYLWKQKLNKAGGKLSAIAPGSRENGLSIPLCRISSSATGQPIPGPTRLLLPPSWPPPAS